MWPTWKENKLFTVFLVVGIIWIAAQVRNDFKEYRYIGKPTEARDTITISGEGKVTAIPDIATIEVGVNTIKADVGSAQKENTDKMNAVTKRVKDLGVDKKDIQTTQYNIYPQYDYNEGKQRLRGYQVTQTARIKIRDLEKIGAILEAVGSAGANQISGVSFTIDEPEKLRQEAREKALDNAREKAKALADHADVKLGKIVTFSESSGGISPPVPYFSKEMALGRGGDVAVAPDVQAGSMEIIVNVNVSYEIL